VGEDQNIGSKISLRKKKGGEFGSTAGQKTKNVLGSFTNSRKGTGEMNKGRMGPGSRTRKGKKNFSSFLGLDTSIQCLGEGIANESYRREGGCGSRGRKETGQGKGATILKS